MSRGAAIFFILAIIVVWSFICASMGISTLHNNKEAVIVVMPQIFPLLGYLIAQKRYKGS